MICELCKRKIQDGEAVSGYRHGEVDNILEVFVPARDADWIIICGKCSERFHRMVYSELNPNTHMFTRDQQER